MASKMCSRCLAYGVQTALRRVKKSGSFPARVAISATLPAREETIFLSSWHTRRHKEISHGRARSFGGFGGVSAASVWRFDALFSDFSCTRAKVPIEKARGRWDLLSMAIKHQPGCILSHLYIGSHIGRDYAAFHYYHERWDAHND